MIQLSRATNANELTCEMFWIVDKIDILFRKKNWNCEQIEKMVTI